MTIDPHPLLASFIHSPGPWQQCGASNSQCKCGRIWSRPADVPIAEALYHRPDDFEESPSFEIACGNALLIAQAPNAPHVCIYPTCPGDVNRRKLELFTELIAAIEAFRDASIQSLFVARKRLSAVIELAKELT